MHLCICNLFGICQHMLEKHLQIPLLENKWLHFFSVVFFLSICVPFIWWPNLLFGVLIVFGAIVL